MRSIARLVNTMHRLTRPISALLLALAVVQHVHASYDALSQSYCSSENTGSDTSAKYWTWQSNGWCHDECVDDYAFAIVQGNNCWCSNYAPADQSSVGDCDTSCPGFPSEQCGNESSGLFGYIALDIKPSGTKGAASSTSSSAMSTPAPPSSSSSFSSSDGPQTVFKTVTASPSKIVFSTIYTSSSSSSSSSSPSPTSAAAATTAAPSTTTTPSPTSSASTTKSWTATPVTSIQVITVSGSVVTKTITGMSTQPAELVQKKNSTSGGAIAGAVIGSLAGVALIAAFLFWFFFYRRRQAEDKANDSEAAKSPPQRNTSTMSRTGLLKSEKAPQPTVVTNLRRNSTHALDHSGSISPASDRRNSRPLFYDQRLNPSALMDLDNGSHTSIITIEDNRDYTRTLNIRNPDPPDQ